MRVTLSSSFSDRVINLYLALVSWCPWPRPGMQCLVILYDINRYYRNCNICEGARARAGFVATWTVTNKIELGLASTYGKYISTEMALDECLCFFELLFCSKALPLTVQIDYFHWGVSTLRVGGGFSERTPWGYLSSDPDYPIDTYCCLFQNRPWDWNWQVCHSGGAQEPWVSPHSLMSLSFRSIRMSTAKCAASLRSSRESCLVFPELMIRGSQTI